MKHLLLLLCPVLISCTTGRPSDQTPDRPPNVVIILADDQGWGDLSTNGNTNLTTPHIDRLAAEGARFDRFYVCAVCSPTRAEMLTGRYHPRGGVYSTSAGGERLDLDETTFPQLFQNAGYATAAFGKWHNGMQYPYHPNARGFDEFYGFCSGHWGDYFSPMLEHNGALVKGEGYLTDDFTGRAMDFMEQNRDRPFLVYLPYNTPHSPMQVPGEWWERFADKSLEQLNRDPDREQINHTRAALAMCENIDWNVGRLMNRIAELGLEEQTIVLYFSDNGPNGWRWNGGMKGRKGSTDEGGVRAPCFIRWPGHIEAGMEVGQIAGAIDLFPTLLELAGIGWENGRSLDGVSLKPLLLDNDPAWEERLIFNHWGSSTSVRSQHYRLDGEDRLFDMAEDPGQYEDVSEQYPLVRQQMMEEKAQWERQVLAELPEHDNRPFPVGHPDGLYTQLPARDGQPRGNIQRSNRYPNCSFFTGWSAPGDSIAWDVEVLAAGEFEVVLYYTCPEGDTGSLVELSFGQSRLTGRVTEGHDPPLTGMENDRDPRIESYVKDFRPLHLGTIRLEKGRGQMSLTAPEIPGRQVMDFRLMMLKRII